MHHPCCALSLLSLYLWVASADVLGPVYPPPRDLSSESSLVPTAWQEISTTLDAYLNGSIENGLIATALAGLENVTFSIGAFSLNDPNVSQSLQYHYTSPEVVQNPNATDEVNGDSIYIIASITKVFTTYAGLLELSEEEWNRPLTQCIPGLANYLQAHSEQQDPILVTQWDKLTPWSLANQQSQVAEQPFLLDYIFRALVPGSGINLADLGFPPVPEYETQLACIANCSGETYALSMAGYHPTFLPWTTPMYSNNGFILLGIAISNITGKPIRDVFRESIFQPLQLASTNASSPTREADIRRSAFVSDTTFFASDSLSAASGGVYSTLNDLAAFGSSILNSTLLNPEQTRRWLKPTTHTASLNYSVGAPWEIIRYTSPQTGKVTDLYTKSGESGDSNTHFVLIPDYNAGFTYLSTTSNATIGASVIGSVLDLVTATLLPALEMQAAAEATTNFAGSYISTDPNLNSSVTITYNESTATNASPALSISEWISNGTNMLDSVYDGISPRLLFSIPNQGNGQVSFQATARPNVLGGPFSGTISSNSDWIYLDVQRYAGVGLGLFIFDVDGNGRATAVSPAVTRATLQRQNA